MNDEREALAQKINAVMQAAYYERHVWPLQFSRGSEEAANAEDFERMTNVVMAVVRDELRRHVVPVSPVRADREAVVEADTLNPRLAGWSYNPNVYAPISPDALRATPEPERAE